jgi:hypothetical protein
MFCHKGARGQGADDYYGAVWLVTASVVWWSEFLAAKPEVPGSILGATRFYE